MTGNACPLGSFGGGSAHGAAHIQHQKPNQDAFGGAQFGAWTIIAVADGHGAAPHFRSDRGARLAVEAAHKAVAHFTHNGRANLDDIAELRANLPAIPAHIIRLWRMAVMLDIEADPLPPEASQDPFIPYGTTCVIAAFGHGMSLFAQVGDGDIIVAGADGTLVTPLPEDHEPTGNQTYSLCQPDAAERFRCRLFVPPHAVAQAIFAIIATDGLSNSFIQREKLLDMFRQWQKIVSDHGVSVACAKMKDWLSNVSSRGNGDDVTLMMYEPNIKTEIRQKNHFMTNNLFQNIWTKLFIYMFIAFIFLILSFFTMIYYYKHPL